MGSHASTPKTKNLLIPSSSTITHQKSVNGEHEILDDLDFKLPSSSLKQPPPVSTHSNSGTKDDTFFDSQACLDSDCDDDFRSVNGDFTPSRGSTSSSQANQYNFLDGATDFNHESSPGTDKKKRLSDLFQVSFADKDLADEHMDIANAKSDVKQAILDPLLSGQKSTKIGSSPYVSSPSRYDQKSTKPATCCLSGLIICRSFRERKNKSNPEPGLAVVTGV